jgi:hypothetical protein
MIDGSLYRTTEDQRWRENVSLKEETMKGLVLTQQMCQYSTGGQGQALTKRCREKKRGWNRKKTKKTSIYKWPCMSHTETRKHHQYNIITREHVIIIT